MKRTLRYYILPALAAIVVWGVPTLAFGVYLFVTSEGGAPAVGIVGVAILECLFILPTAFAWLLILRIRWKRKSDVRKRILFGAPSVFGALPGCAILIILTFALRSEPHTTWEAIRIFISLSAFTAGLAALGFAGSATWYQLAYERPDTKIQTTAPAGAVV